jgi:glycosyltransferase involved in cell wall biosynthesis
MQVVICSDGIFPERIGGIQRHTRLLVETLAAEHPALDLVVVHPHVGRRVFADSPAVREITVAPRPGRKQYLLECHDLSKRIAEVLRTLPDAVIYSQGYAVWSGAKEFAPRLIVNFHGLESFQALTLKDWLIGMPFRAVTRRIARDARFVVSLGGRLTTILRTIVSQPDRRLVVLPNGVNVPADPAPDRQRRPGGLSILFVGRFAANKGIGDLLEAYRIVTADGDQSGTELHLVGDGPLYADLKASHERPDVHFHGKASDEVLDGLYRSVDLFVLPTLFEGMPTVVLEAMARGLPIAVTDVGATRELVDDTNGFIIPKRDPGSLAATLRAFARLSAEQRRSLGAASLCKVRERFTWSAVAAAHVRLFERVAAG